MEVTFSRLSLIVMELGNLGKRVTEEQHNRYFVGTEIWIYHFSLPPSFFPFPFPPIFLPIFSLQPGYNVTKDSAWTNCGFVFLFTSIRLRYIQCVVAYAKRKCSMQAVQFMQVLATSLLQSTLGLYHSSQCLSIGYVNCSSTSSGQY